MEQNTELRGKPEIQAIAEYLRGMKFKKQLMGGCRTESVLDHLSAVTLQYEAIISAGLARERRQASQITQLEAELSWVRQEQNAGAEHQRRITEWYEENIAWLQAQTNALQQQLAAQQNNPWQSAYAQQPSAYEPQLVASQAPYEPVWYPVNG